MKKINLQKMFDKISVHLVKQNKKSQRPGGNGCLYRSPEGLQCAIGCLIPKTKYKPEMEVPESTFSPDGFGVSQILDVLGYEVDLDAEMALGDLQKLHDDEKPSRWPQKLRAFARKHSLNFDKMQEYLESVGRK